jgi:serine/threonine protein kinase
MEFVEGETLDSLIKRSGPLEVKRALEITMQVGAGLAAVHKKKLVHRDIKPSNIMVSVEDEGVVTAKIIDLGLAKTVDEAEAQTTISATGAFAGTPEFASPEQFAGVGVDIRSDLYSLGVMLWEMVTGHALFSGSPAEVMYQHQHAPLPLEQREDLPQPVVVLLEILLEKDPGWRFQTPAELLKALPGITGAIEEGRVFREEITRGSLAAEDEASRGHIRLRIAAQPQIEREDVKDSQMLSLVFVNALHLHVEEGFRGDDGAGAFGNERGKTLFVSELGGAPLLLKLWIIGKRFELAKLV